MRHGNNKVLMNALALILTCLCISACNGGGASDTGAGSRQPAGTAMAGATDKIDKIKIKNASGETVAVLKAKHYGFKVLDGDGADLGKIKRDGDRLKVKIGGETRFKVKPKGEKSFKLSDSDGNTVVAVKWQDGKWKIKDGAGSAIAAIKRKSSSWAAYDATGGLIGKVKTRDAKSKIVDASGETLFSVSDTATAAGAALLAVSNIPIIQRCALYLYFREHHW